MVPVDVNLELIDELLFVDPFYTVAAATVHGLYFIPPVGERVEVRSPLREMPYEEQYDLEGEGLGDHQNPQREE
jgi:hypothetical protein